MVKELERLLYNRFLLYSKKHTLLSKIGVKSYLSSIKILSQIHLIVIKEISINKKICNYLQKKSFNQDVKSKFVIPVCLNLNEINLVLNKESELLYKTNLFMYIVFGGKSFNKKIVKIKGLTEKEKELNKTLFELTKKLPKNYVKSELRLLLELQEELKKLRSSIGNIELVKKHAGKIIVIVGKVQKTEIYGFIEKDVLFIKTKAEYIMKHPKENKLIYFLTAVYIVAPFTFEATGVFLLFRYLGKYTISRAKNLRV